MAAPDAPRPERPRGVEGALVTFAVALAARLAVVAWAAPRFPPTADGKFYQTVAERISRGLGYTWLWPDGAVTYAAHYPVGYPALLGGIYAVTGPHPAAAMVFNAFLGALAAVAAHRLAVRAAGPRVALASGLAVALHPGLVAYTPAIMTEGVTAALVICACAVAAWARGRRTTVAPAIAVGLVLGVATLVRPQSLVLAPILGLLAGWRGTRTALARAAAMSTVATLAALLVCAPWTARNCVRMNHCALVSVNGGWNLLIGADAASTGAWSPVKVPAACREVFDEAQKDVCFGREARRYVREHPAAWLSLVPLKLAATFDYAGAAPWYLHEADAAAFPYADKERLGALETLYERVALLLCLSWVARRAGEEGRPTPVALAFIGGLFAFSLHAWEAYAALLAAALLRGRSLWEGPVLASGAVAVLGATMATHAVFFGAGRYSLVVFPVLTALAPLAFARPRPGDEVEDVRSA